MSERIGEDVLRPTKIVVCIEQAVDLGAVLGPLLDLVKIALVGVERVVGFFAGTSRCWSSQSDNY